MSKHLHLICFFVAASLLLSCESTTYETTEIEGKNIAIGNQPILDESIEEFIAPYRQQIDKEMNKVLAFAPNSMFKTDSRLNTAIGNMMADAVMDLGKPLVAKTEGEEIDVVLLNFGGIRAGINQGNITTRTAYEIMPFDNQLVVVKLAYPEMQALVDYLVERKLAHPFSGMKLVLDKDGEFHSLEIVGQSLDEEKTYLVATSDYLLTGGDQMSFFENNQGVIETNYKLRNLFIDYFEKIDTIQSKQDDRFIQLK